MIEEIEQISTRKKDIRKTGWVLGILAVLAGGYLFWKHGDGSLIFITAGAVLLLVSTIVPVVLKPLHLAWMTLAVILGWIMSRVILIVLFYLVVTPVALAARLAGTQFLELKWDSSQATYWNARETSPVDKEQYEKQF